MEQWRGKGFGNGGAAWQTSLGQSLPIENERRKKKEGQTRASKPGIYPRQLKPSKLS